MSIVNIRVKNFRSLREIDVAVTPLTVLVGCNDEGKSNLLRALDLFFNGSKAEGYQFNWERDFCAFAKVAKNKAPEIEIQVTYQLPDTFKLAEHVKWVRTWREVGPHREQVGLVNGDNIPSRSKANSFLQSIRYEYVPAIKGLGYFEKLLSSVHDMLDATVRSDIRTAAEGFTAEISKHTSGILAELEQRLGLKSEIELPGDLRRLFSDLEFRSEAGDHKVALSQRGDGIKVRHVPVILQWLAEQANHLSAPGRPRTVTIWGYEEPENNLEIRRCFELAEYFLENSQSIQTFLTTHSPVYYSVFRGATNSDEIRLFEVQSSQALGTFLIPRTVGSANDIDAIHSSIGFLELLEPHVQDWKQKVDHLEQRIAEGLDTSVPTIFVEGPTDRIILNAIISTYFPDVQVNVKCAEANGGGHSWVRDSLIAWHYRRDACLAVGLFDADAAAQCSIKDFQHLVEDRAKKPRAFKHRLKPDGPSRELAKLQLKVPTAIEEICPLGSWNVAAEKDWLEPRPDVISTFNFSETDITFDKWISDRVTDPSLLRVATSRVKEESKMKFAKHVARSIRAGDQETNFEPLINLTRVLLKKIRVLAHES